MKLGCIISIMVGVFLVSNITLLSGQMLEFSHYRVSDGLSQSEILCIFQDSEGYMWFGTQNGLNKFDGYSFERFFNDPADPYTISNNWVFGITEDQNGVLWIGTKGGLNKYEKKTGLFSIISLSDTIVDTEDNIFTVLLQMNQIFILTNRRPYLY